MPKSGKSAIVIIVPHSCFFLCANGSCVMCPEIAYPFLSPFTHYVIT